MSEVIIPVPTIRASGIVVNYSNCDKALSTSSFTWAGGWNPVQGAAGYSPIPSRGEG